MRLASIRHVRQGHTFGCVLASLAMIGGETYAEVAAQYPWVLERDGGCDLDTVSFDYLWRHGFAMQVVYPTEPRGACPSDISVSEWRKRYGRKPWPPAPWALAHLCQVETSQSHAVIMLADGSVLDPLDERPRRLADYARVMNVRGVFDIAAPLSPREADR